MGFAGNITKPGQIAPPTTPIAAAAFPVEVLASMAFGDKFGSNLVGGSSANPQANPQASGAAKSKGGGGAFPGFTPATTSPSLQMPMTANKTLTGQ